MPDRSGRGGVKVAVLGAVNWDTTLFVDSFAAPGDEVPVTRVQEGPGGKGANVAVALARLMGEGRVSFVGAVGDDGAGRALREDMESEGVGTEGAPTLKGSRTGTAHIVVDGGGRKAIHTHFGANENLLPRHLEAPEAAKAVSGASTVVVMDVPYPTALAAARKAKGAGARVVFSPGVRAVLRYARLRQVLGLSAAVVLDRSEILRVRPGSTPTSSLKLLTERLPSLTAVATLGAAGSAVGERGRVMAVPPVDLADLGMRAVNSAGAGDAFLAAYVVYSGFGLPPGDAARWGNLAGALKAADPRTRGSPSREALEKRMGALDLLRRRPRG